MDFTPERYYLELAAAFVRGRRPDAPALPHGELLAWGEAQGLKLHKFKRAAELPRVRAVLGLLRGLILPDGALLDVGSGRGVFLWTLLDQLPELQVTAVDIDPLRVRDLGAVRDGGISRLTPLLADVRALDLPPRSQDVVTFLEVLEHLDQPETALQRALSVARQALILSVPSKEDDNPEHIHLFDEARLRAMLAAAGARRVRVSYVPGHIIALASP